MLTALASLAGCGQSGSRPQAAKDFAIPINLRCTTCDDFIRCATQDGKPGSVLYRLKEKTFWAQIATIGDYLTQLVRDKTTDARPLTIYREQGGARSIEHDPAWRVQIDAMAARITVLDRQIDQRRGAWLDAAGANVGQCRALPRREGYALVRQFIGKPALPSGGGAGSLRP